MKCPRCWTEKAYVYHMSGWRGMFMAAMLRVPMKCHHCYHKFSVWWFCTLGKQATPPQKQAAATVRPMRPSYAAEQLAATQKGPCVTRRKPERTVQANHP